MEGLTGLRSGYYGSQADPDLRNSPMAQDALQNTNQDLNRDVSNWNNGHAKFSRTPFNNCPKCTSTSQTVVKQKGVTGTGKVTTPASTTTTTQSFSGQYSYQIGDGTYQDSQGTVYYQDAAQPVSASVSSTTGAQSQFGPNPMFDGYGASVQGGPTTTTTISPTTNYPANEFPTSPNGLNINPAPDPQPFYANPPTANSPLLQQQSARFFK